MIFNPQYVEVTLDGIVERESEDSPPKKRSRTAELRAQKEAAVWEVKRILNSLQFVEKYNRGFGLETPGNSNSWSWFYPS